MQFGFEFKGETSKSYGVYVEKRPAVPGRTRKTEYVEVSGRDEPLTVQDSGYGNVTIPVTCAYRVPEERWHEKRREILQWLSGSGKLIFSDSPDTFFSVKEITIDKFERTIKKYGKFQANFICSPFEYLMEGQEEKAAKEVAWNPYTAARPVYIITGSGKCTLKVNGKSMEATVGHKLYIDCEKMMSYEEDGILQNTTVKGDYEDLILKNGENTVTVSSGFELKVIPNWRY